MTPAQSKQLKAHVEAIAKLLYADAVEQGMCLGSLGEIEQSEIDQRLQLPGAQWLPRNVPQMLALCCRCLSDQLDLQSLPRR